MFEGIAKKSQALVDKLANSVAVGLSDEDVPCSSDQDEVQPRNKLAKSEGAAEIGYPDGYAQKKYGRRRASQFLQSYDKRIATDESQEGNSNNNNNNKDDDNENKVCRGGRGGRNNSSSNSNNNVCDDDDDSDDSVRILPSKKAVLGSGLVRDHPVTPKVNAKKRTAEGSFDDDFVDNTDDWGKSDRGRSGSSSKKTRTRRKRKDEEEEEEEDIDECDDDDDEEAEWVENDKDRLTKTRASTRTRARSSAASVHANSGTHTLIRVAEMLDPPPRREVRPRQAKAGTSYVIDLNEDDDDDDYIIPSSMKQVAKTATFKTPYKKHDDVPVPILTPSWLNGEREAIRSGSAYSNIRSLQQKIVSYANDCDDVQIPFGVDLREHRVCLEVRMYGVSVAVDLLGCRLGALRVGFSDVVASSRAVVNRVSNTLEISFVYENPYIESASVATSDRYSPSDIAFVRHLGIVGGCSSDRLGLGSVTTEVLDMSYIQRVTYFQLGSACVGSSQESSEHVVLLEIEIEHEAVLFRYFKSLTAGRDKLFDPVAAPEGDPRRYIALHMTMVSMNRLLQELRLCTSWVECANGRAAAEYDAINSFSILSSKETPQKTIKAYISGCRSLDGDDRRRETLMAGAEELRKLERARNRTKSLCARPAAPLNDVEGNEIFLTYPFASADTDGADLAFIDRDSVIIYKKDLARFNDREYFNDALVDLKSKLVLERLAQGEHSALRSMIHIFTCNLFVRLNPDQEQGSEVGHSFVSRWTKKIDVFALRYVLFPVNYGNHWSLAVAVNPGALYRESERAEGPGERCCLLFMDPLNIHDIGKVYDIVLGYLSSEFDHRKRRSGLTFVGDMTRIRCMVPQQSNSYDCGVFVAKFIEGFVEHVCAIDHSATQSPFSLAASETYFNEACLKDSFGQSDVTREREVYRRQVGELAQQWREHTAARAGLAEREEEDSLGAVLLEDTRSTNDKSNNSNTNNYANDNSSRNTNNIDNSAFHNNFV